MSSTAATAAAGAEMLRVQEGEVVYFVRERISPTGNGSVKEDNSRGLGQSKGTTMRRIRSFSEVMGNSRTLIAPLEDMDNKGFEERDQPTTQFLAPSQDALLASRVWDVPGGVRREIGSRLVGYKSWNEKSEEAMFDLSDRSHLNTDGSLNTITETDLTTRVILPPKIQAMLDRTRIMNQTEPKGGAYHTLKSGDRGSQKTSAPLSENGGSGLNVGVTRGSLGLEKDMQSSAEGMRAVQQILSTRPLRSTDFVQPTYEAVRVPGRNTHPLIIRSITEASKPKVLVRNNRANIDRLPSFTQFQALKAAGRGTVETEEVIYVPAGNVVGGRKEDNKVLQEEVEEEERAKMEAEEEAVDMFQRTATLRAVSGSRNARGGEVMRGGGTEDWGDAVVGVKIVENAKEKEVGRVVEGVSEGAPEDWGGVGKRVRQVGEEVSRTEYTKAAVGGSTGVSFRLKADLGEGKVPIPQAGGGVLDRGLGPLPSPDSILAPETNWSEVEAVVVSGGGPEVGGGGTGGMTTLVERVEESVVITDRVAGGIGRGAYLDPPSSVLHRVRVGGDGGEKEEVEKFMMMMSKKGTIGKGSKSRRRSMEACRSDVEQLIQNWGRSTSLTSDRKEVEDIHAEEASKEVKNIIYKEKGIVHIQGTR